MEATKYPEHLVFGLDIGTRSIVGTVGYKENTGIFRVVAQVVLFHETRAMLNGQIHDIDKVAESIRIVKQDLEKKIGKKLKNVLIAAAGRVLKTLTVKADHSFADETLLKDEHVHSLELMAVEKAYDLLREEQHTEDINYYCVGYSVVRYFLNDYPITKLEGHRALRIGTQLLATFLPKEVVDSLYAAVEGAGLYVENLTLEPIAAMEVAIPEQFRLLNIALVDVGAGTSDISITKDGSIAAFGMIPNAGDEITESLAKKCLVDFKTAEKIKIEGWKKKSISYKDILGVSHKISGEEILKDSAETIKRITESIGKRIIELNGGKTVSAVFLVGGGGKLPGFTEQLAKQLGLAPERVAIRGAEVLQQVEFYDSHIKKDSLLVTPIGICLNFYGQRNSFIFVQVNGERIKLYDNSKLTIVDAAVHGGISNEALFPRRGKPVDFTVNGEPRFVRGSIGEASIIRLNGKTVGINAAIGQNDKIEITESTAGEDAAPKIGSLPEYSSIIGFVFNGKHISCPKFVKVNGELVSEFYVIQEGDQIEILNFYTLSQVLAFMDVEYSGIICVNNIPAGPKERVYENFTIDCNLDLPACLPDLWEEKPEITVFVNETEVALKQKKSYILVDVLDFYPMDLSLGKEKKMRLKVNGTKADFTTAIGDGDNIIMEWEEPYFEQ